MSFNPSQMQKMMKQVQQMQKDMARVQEQLRNETVEAEAGGVVRATFNGHGALLAIHIDPQAVDPNDVEMLEDLIVTAVQEGQRKVEALAQERLGAVTSGLKLPGMPGLL